MNGKPYVSVIINCYNSDTFLKEAIDSVVNQTYKDFELIFWDNQSTDKSAQIVKSYNDDRIRYFYAPNFTLLGEARNLAISKASGQWIAFLDSDDYWEINKLQESIDSLNNYSRKEEVSLVYTKTKMIDSKGSVFGEYKRVESGEIRKKLLKDGSFIVQSSIMIRKDVFDDVLGINPKLNYCPDYDLLLKVTKKHHAIGINSFLTFYRVHEGSITSLKNFDNTIEEVNFLINYYQNNELDYLTIKFIKKNVATKINSLFLKLILQKKFKEINFLVKNYFFYILFFPLSFLIIIKNRILLLVNKISTRNK